AAAPGVGVGQQSGSAGAWWCELAWPGLVTRPGAGPAYRSAPQLQGGLELGEPLLQRGDVRSLRRQLRLMPYLKLAQRLDQHGRELRVRERQVAVRFRLDQLRELLRDILRQEPDLPIPAPVHTLTEPVRHRLETEHAVQHALQRLDLLLEPRVRALRQRAGNLQVAVLVERQRVRARGAIRPVAGHEERIGRDPRAR